MKNLLTISEVCKILQVKESWLRKRITLKEIPYVKIGGKIRFDEEQLKEWIKKNGK